jgi:hypothetical protein
MDEEKINVQQSAISDEPLTPNKQQSRRILRVTLISVLALIIIGGSAFATYTILNPTPSADSILGQAKSANLRDAAFTLSGSISLSPNQSTQSSGFSIQGQGKYTANPLRQSLQLTVINMQLEIITDGNNTYIKGLSAIIGSDYPWLQLPENSNSSTGSDSIFRQVYNQMKNVTLIGSEQINGKNTWHLRGNISNPGKETTSSSPKSTPVDVWVLKDNYFPAQIQLTGANASTIGLGNGMTGTSNTPTPIGGGAGTLNLTVTFTNWNSGNTIDLPSPDQVGHQTP